MPHVLLVPLDNRDCVAAFPGMIARVAGWEGRTPPVAALGSLQRDADLPAIHAWLADAARDPEARALVVAVDTLAYGGLVPSRRSSDGAETVLGRLEVLRQIRQARPALPIYAFNMVQRVSNCDSAEEEKPYWAEYGRKIYRYSYLDDRLTQGVDAGEALDAVVREHLALRDAIPADALEDYRRGRARNHAVNRRLIAWVEEGLVDLLVFPQDDTGAFGWNVREAHDLRMQVAARGLERKVLVYPGADEVASALTCRAILQAEGRRPRAFPLYATTGGERIVPMYADRGYGELVRTQVHAAGGVLAPDAATADLLLFLNTPGRAQDDIWLDRDAWLPGRGGDVDTGDRFLPGFVAQIADALEAGRAAAVADVAYANGADPAFMPILMDGAPYHRLHGYAAWNTAGNTLGTVIPHALCRLVGEAQGADPRRDRAHATLLVHRAADDWLYLSDVRLRARDEGQGGTPEAIAAALEAKLRPWFATHMAGKPVGAFTPTGLGPVTVAQPWQRLFEATIRFELEPRA